MRLLHATVVVFLLSTCAHAQFGGPQDVVVDYVQVRRFETSSALVATIEPITRTTIASEVEGQVAQRMFDEGTEVGTDVIARLDTDLPRIQRATAAAVHRSALAALEQAKAQAQKTKSELVRVQGLIQTAVATDKEITDARADDDAAQAAVRLREADVQEKQSDVERLDLLIRKADIRSPFRGSVAKRYIEVGQWVNQGDPIAEVVRTDALYARCWVPEALIARIEQDSQALIEIDATGRTVSGLVEQILPEADPASRTFAVKIRIDNPERTIRAGLSARARFALRTAEPVTLVPLDALVTTVGSTHVVAARNGMATIVPVQRGAQYQKLVAVTGELADGELIVVKGNEMLREGTPLRFVAPPRPATQPTTGPATQPAGPTTVPSTQPNGA